MTAFANSRTKIIATLGPSCATPHGIADLMHAGVDVFRLNMAHGSPEELETWLVMIRQAAAKLGRVVAVLADLAGPKIRLGELPEGGIQCQEGAEFTFVRGEQSDDPARLVTTYSQLIDDLAVDDRVMLADGTVSLQVIERGPEFARCRVVQSGIIRSRQGVNLPGVWLRTPAMTEEDRRHALWAAKADIDFVGMSFVRSADDVRELKQLLRDAGSQAWVVAKIEKPEALENLDEIVRAADAVMVARGDLGVEIDVARIAVVQKEVIAACNHLRRPVIVATQMLDSMQHNRRPTRAETTDVANAVLDGADACMLSGETAVGDYPRESVEMMNRIALATEALFRGVLRSSDDDEPAPTLHPITQAMVYGASRIARRLDARLLVVASHSGATALALANRRNFVPTIGVSDREATLRRMCLFWGVHPLPGADPRYGRSARLRRGLGRQAGPARRGRPGGRGARHAASARSAKRLGRTRVAQDLNPELDSPSFVCDTSTQRKRVSR